MNYFKILNLPPQYDLKAEDIENNYLQEQGKYHPDLAPPGQKIAYIERSSQINRAKDILLDSLMRGEHLLSLLGVTYNEEIAKEALGAEELEFFFTQFEKSHNLQKEEELTNCLCKYRATKEEITAIIKQAFTEKQYPLVIENLVKLKYYNNLITYLKQKLQTCN